MNWLLLFIPITLLLEHFGVPPTLLFFSAAIAIVPIAAMIVRATEQVASRTGEGLTSASTFTKRRRCVMSDALCIR